MGGSLAERFPGLQVLRRLGDGASGTVYLARQVDLDRLVAVKVLGGPLVETPRFRERFAREARVMADHPHPGLVPVFDAQLDGDPAYIVMAYMAGGDLGRHRDPGDRLSPQQVLWVGIRVAEALAHLHEQGVLHRDVKPENLFWDEDRGARLGDLGLGLPQDARPLTETDVVVGTPNYMAPELFEARAYSPASDVYALAATLHELATGALPRQWPDLRVPVDFQDEDLGVPGLAAPLMWALRVEPEDRLRSAAELAELLREALPVDGPAGPGAGTWGDLPGASTATLEPEELDTVSVNPAVSPPVAPPPAAPGSRARRAAPWVGGFLLGLLGAASLGGPAALPRPPRAGQDSPGVWILPATGGRWHLARRDRAAAGRAPAQAELWLQAPGAAALARPVRLGPTAPEQVGLWADAHGAVLLWEESRGASTGVLVTDPRGGHGHHRRVAGTGWSVSGLDRDRLELARFDERFRAPRRPGGQDGG